MLHLKEAIRVMGIDNVCFGFDFMDYFNSDKTMNIEELKEASELQALINKLISEGYSTKEIEKLTYYNLYNRFNRHIFSHH